MAKRDIHLNLLTTYESPAIRFLQSGNFKNQLTHNKDNIEVTINIDTKDMSNTKEVAKGVTELILDILKYNYLKEYIENNYCKINEKEKNEIYKSALIKVESKETFLRNNILNRTLSHILENEYLNMDGFLKFRMKDILDHIPLISDIALEEFLIKRDQEEFFSVLKYFIGIQEEKIDLLRIHINKDYSYILYDKDGKEVECIEDEEITKIMLQENLNYEDFLISTLLSLCPHKIEILDTINDNGSKDMIHTIRSIFGTRVKKVLSN